METHPDADARRDWLRSLEDKATRMKAAGQSEITTGGGPLAEWQHGRVRVRKMPDDEHGLLRISVGGGDTPLEGDYCTFRGDREQCIALLNRALNALLRGPDA